MIGCTIRLITYSLYPSNAFSMTNCAIFFGLLNMFYVYDYSCYKIIFNFKHYCFTSCTCGYNFSIWCNQLWFDNILNKNEHFVKNHEICYSGGQPVSLIPIFTVAITWMILFTILPWYKRNQFASTIIIFVVLTERLFYF